MRTPSALHRPCSPARFSWPCCWRCRGGGRAPRSIARPRPKNRCSDLCVPSRRSASGPDRRPRRSPSALVAPAAACSVPAARGVSVRFPCPRVRRAAGTTQLASTAPPSERHALRRARRRAVSACPDRIRVRGPAGTVTGAAGHGAPRSRPSTSCCRQRRGGVAASLKDGVGGASSTRVCPRCSQSRFDGRGECIARTSCPLQSETNGGDQSANRTQFVTLQTACSIRMLLLLRRTFAARSRLTVVSPRS